MISTIANAGLAPRFYLKDLKMGFSKCTGSDFEQIRKMGFQIDISGVVPKIAAFPEKWIETGRSGCMRKESPGCLCAGEFRNVITFPSGNQKTRTDFVSLKIFSVKEYGESDRCNEGDLIVTFDGF